MTKSIFCTPMSIPEGTVSLMHRNAELSVAHLIMWSWPTESEFGETFRSVSSQSYWAKCHMLITELWVKRNASISQCLCCRKKKGSVTVNLFQSSNHNYHFFGVLFGLQYQRVEIKVMQHSENWQITKHSQNILEPPKIDHRESKF